MEEKILLIDGMNAVWRANISFGQKDKNEFVIIYNFFRNLRATVEEFKPRKIFFCLEGKNNFRYNLLPSYKENRKKASKDGSVRLSDNFISQFSLIKELVKLLPITTVYADGFECDDVIATLCENLKDESVIILSNDSDYIQLLQKGYKNLKIYNPFKKSYVEPPSYHYLTWKCLSGDKSTDNIPGIISKKKAEKIASNPALLEEFLSVQENISNYILNKKLIELQIIPIEDLSIEDYEVDFEKLKECFTRFDFKSIISDNYWIRFCDTFKCAAH